MDIEIDQLHRRQDLILRSLAAGTRIMEESRPHDTPT
jgi:hypothetical protein